MSDLDFEETSSLSSDGEDPVFDNNDSSGSDREHPFAFTIDREAYSSESAEDHSFHQSDSDSDEDHPFHQSDSDSDEDHSFRQSDSDDDFPLPIRATAPSTSSLPPTHEPVRVMAEKPRPVSEAATPPYKEREIKVTARKQQEMEKGAELLENIAEQSYQLKILSEEAPQFISRNPKTIATQGLRTLESYKSHPVWRNYLSRIFPQGFTDINAFYSIEDPIKIIFLVLLDKTLEEEDRVILFRSLLEAGAKHHVTYPREPYKDEPLLHMVISLALEEPEEKQPLYAQLLSLLLHHGADAQTPYRDQSPFQRVLLEEKTQLLARVMMRHGVPFDRKILHGLEHPAPLPAKEPGFNPLSFRKESRLTLFQYALWKEDPWLAKTLLKHGASATRSFTIFYNEDVFKEISPLAFAIISGQEAVVRYLLKKYSFDLNSPQKFKIECHHEEKPINQNLHTSLLGLAAVDYPHQGIFNALMEKGASLDSLALHLSRKQKKALNKRLSHWNENPLPQEEKKQKEDPLLGIPYIPAPLPKAPQSLSPEARDTQTLLQEIRRPFLHKKALKKALEHANIDGISTDHLGNIPLAVAILEKKPSALSYLIKRGAHLKFETLGTTALHLACEQGDENALSLLLSSSRGEKLIHEEDFYSNTPLDIALKNRHFKLAHQLLAAGAQPRGPLPEEMELEREDFSFSPHPSSSSSHNDSSIASTSTHPSPEEQSHPSISPSLSGTQPSETFLLPLKEDGSWEALRALDPWARLLTRSPSEFYHIELNPLANKDLENQAILELHRILSEDPNTFSFLHRIFYKPQSSLLLRSSIETLPSTGTGDRPPLGIGRKKPKVSVFPWGVGTPLQELLEKLINFSTPREVKRRIRPVLPILLAAGAYKELKPHSHFFYRAIWQGDYGVVKALAQSGKIAIQGKPPTEFAPIHFAELAAAKDRRELEGPALQLLLLFEDPEKLRVSTKIHEALVEKPSPLHLAIEYGRSHIAELLLQYGFDKSDFFNGNNLFLHACKKDLIPLALTLLKREPAFYQSPLFILTDKKPLPSSPLERLALRGTSLPIYLPPLGRKIIRTLMTPVQLATFLDKPQFLQALHPSEEEVRAPFGHIVFKVEGQEIETMGMLPLQFAIAMGRADLVEELLSNAAKEDLNKKSVFKKIEEDKETPVEISLLELALFIYPNATICSHLITHGASLEQAVEHWKETISETSWKIIEGLRSENHSLLPFSPPKQKTSSSVKSPLIPLSSLSPFVRAEKRRNAIDELKVLAAQFPYLQRIFTEDETLDLEAQHPSYKSPPLHETILYDEWHMPFGKIPPYDKIRIVRALIYAGARVARLPNWDSEIFLRIVMNLPRTPFEILDALLEAGANIEEECMGKTPLQWAVFFKNHSMVSYLISRGAALEGLYDNSTFEASSSSEKHTALYFACERRVTLSIAKSLLQGGAKIPKEFFDPHHMFLVTLVGGVFPRIVVMNALQRAVYFGHTELVKILVESRQFTVDGCFKEIYHEGRFYRDYPLIHYALSTQNPLMWEYLLPHSKQLNLSSKKLPHGHPWYGLLHRAILRGDPGTVKSILANRGLRDLLLENPTQEGDTPLILALKQNQYLCAKLLLEAGASLSKTDAEGREPRSFTNPEFPAGRVFAESEEKKHAFLKRLADLEMNPPRNILEMQGGVEAYQEVLSKLREFLSSEEIFYFKRVALRLWRRDVASPLKESLVYVERVLFPNKKFWRFAKESPSPQPSPPRGEGARSSSAITRGEGAGSSSAITRGEGAGSSSAITRGEGAGRGELSPLSLSLSFSSSPSPLGGEGWGEGWGEGENPSTALTKWNSAAAFSRTSSKFYHSPPFFDIEAADVPDYIKPGPWAVPRGRANDWEVISKRISLTGKADAELQRIFRENPEKLPFFHQDLALPFETTLQTLIHRREYPTTSPEMREEIESLLPITLAARYYKKSFLYTLLQRALTDRDYPLIKILIEGGAPLGAISSHKYAARGWGANFKLVPVPPPENQGPSLEAMARFTGVNFIEDRRSCPIPPYEQFLTAFTMPKDFPLEQIPSHQLYTRALHKAFQEKNEEVAIQMLSYYATLHSGADYAALDFAAGSDGNSRAVECLLHHQDLERLDCENPLVMLVRRRSSTSLILSILKQLQLTMETNPEPLGEGDPTHFGPIMRHHNILYFPVLIRGRYWDHPEMKNCTFALEKIELFRKYYVKAYMTPLQLAVFFHNPSLIRALNPSVEEASRPFQRVLYVRRYDVIYRENISPMEYAHLIGDTPVVHTLRPYVEKGGVPLLEETSMEEELGKDVVIRTLYSQAASVSSQQASLPEHVRLGPWNNLKVKRKEVARTALKEFFSAHPDLLPFPYEKKTPRQILPILIEKRAHPSTSPEMQEQILEVLPIILAASITPKRYVGGLPRGYGYDFLRRAIEYKDYPLAKILIEGGISPPELSVPPPHPSLHPGLFSPSLFNILREFTGDGRAIKNIDSSLLPPYESFINAFTRPADHLWELGNWTSVGYRRELLYERILHEAFQQRNEKIVALLLERFSKSIEREEEQQTFSLLHLAITHHDVHTAEYLVRQRHFMHQKNTSFFAYQIFSDYETLGTVFPTLFYHTPLVRAAQKEIFTPVVLLLLEHSPRDMEYSLILHLGNHPSKREYDSALAKMLAFRKYYVKTSMTIVQLAVFFNNVSLLRALNPSEKEVLHPFQRVAFENEDGKRFDAENLSPLEYAIMRKYTAVAELLLAYAPNVDVNKKHRFTVEKIRGNETGYFSLFELALFVHPNEALCLYMMDRGARLEETLQYWRGPSSSVSQAIIETLRARGHYSRPPIPSSSSRDPEEDYGPPPSSSFSRALINVPLLERAPTPGETSASTSALTLFSPQTSVPTHSPAAASIKTSVAPREIWELEESYLPSSTPVACSSLSFYEQRALDHALRILRKYESTPSWNAYLHLVFETTPPDVNALYGQVPPTSMLFLLLLEKTLRDDEKLEILEALLKAKANPNVVYYGKEGVHRGETPLHMVISLAIKNADPQREEFFKHLLRAFILNGAHTQVRWDDKTPLHRLLMEEKTASLGDYLRQLGVPADTVVLHQGIIPSILPSEAFGFSFNPFNYLKIFTKSPMEMHTLLQSMLSRPYGREKATQRAKALLADGANPHQPFAVAYAGINFKNITPLEFAIISRQEEIVRALLQRHSFNLNEPRVIEQERFKNNETTPYDAPLYASPLALAAIHYPHQGICQALLEAGASMDSLFESGDITSEQKAQLTATLDSWRPRPVSSSAKREESTLVVPASSGNTSKPISLEEDAAILLMTTIRKEDYENLSYLIHKGAHLNLEPFGMNALHFACSFNKEMALSLLLQSPRGLALLNEQDLEGNTPLHLALLNQNKRMAKWLLRAGADADIKNEAGISPREIPTTTYEEIINASQEKISALENTLEVLKKQHPGYSLLFSSLEKEMKAHPVPPLRRLIRQWFYIHEGSIFAADADPIKRALLSKESHGEAFSSMGPSTSLPVIESDDEDDLTPVPAASTSLSTVEEPDLGFCPVCGPGQDCSYPLFPKTSFLATLEEEREVRDAVQHSIPSHLQPGPWSLRRIGSEKCFETAEKAFLAIKELKRFYLRNPKVFPPLDVDVLFKDPGAELSKILYMLFNKRYNPPYSTCVETQKKIIELLPIVLAAGAHSLLNEESFMLEKAIKEKDFLFGKILVEGGARLTQRFYQETWAVNALSLVPKSTRAAAPIRDFLLNQAYDQPSYDDFLIAFFLEEEFSKTWTFFGISKKLYTAFQQKDEKTLGELLSKFQDTLARERKMESPLHQAISQGNLPMAELIALYWGDASRFFCHEPIVRAAQKEMFTPLVLLMLHELLAHNTSLPKPEAVGQGEPHFQAIRRGTHTWFFPVLLRLGDTPPNVEALSSNVEKMEAYKRYYVKSYMTPLQLAVFYNNPRLIKALNPSEKEINRPFQRLVFKMEDGEWMDREGMTLLEYAVTRGFPRVVEALLSYPHVDLNEKRYPIRMEGEERQRKVSLFELALFIYPNETICSYMMSQGADLEETVTRWCAKNPLGQRSMNVIAALQAKESSAPSLSPPPSPSASSSTIEVLSVDEEELAKRQKAIATLRELSVRFSLLEEVFTASGAFNTKILHHDTRGSSPLERAFASTDLSTQDRVQIVRALLDAGVSPSISGKTPPLIWVAWSDPSLIPLEIAEALLEAGADLEATFEGKTALHHAILRGRKDLVSYLIARGANLETPYERPDSSLASLLHKIGTWGFEYAATMDPIVSLAAQGTHLETPHERPNSSAIRPFHELASRGFEYVRENLLPSPSASLEMRTPLYFACETQKTLGLAKALLRAGARIPEEFFDPRHEFSVSLKNGSTVSMNALQRAIFFRHTELVRALLESKRFKVDNQFFKAVTYGLTLYKGCSAITYAKISAQQEVVDYLLPYTKDHKALKREKQARENCLHRAILRGDAKTLKNILENPSLQVLINKHAPEGDTPLILALKQNQYQCAKILLEAGASPLHTDAQGRTATEFKHPQYPAGRIFSMYEEKKALFLKRLENLKRNPPKDMRESLFFINPSYKHFLQELEKQVRETPYPHLKSLFHSWAENNLVTSEKEAFGQILFPKEKSWALAGKNIKDTPSKSDFTPPPPAASSFLSRFFASPSAAGPSSSSPPPEDSFVPSGEDSSSFGLSYEGFSAFSSDEDSSSPFSSSSDNPYSSSKSFTGGW